MNKVTNKVVSSSVVLTAFAFLLLSGCEQNFGLVRNDPATTTSGPNAPVICDPIGNGSNGTTSANGLKGSLYYLDRSEALDKDGKNTYTGISDFFTKGHLVTDNLFMSYFYVPTQAFSKGFSTPGGQTLAKADGTKLVDYFAFKMSGGIQLKTGSATKKYQFGIISDDGARLTISKKQTDGTYKDTLLVNSDGDHGSLFSVALTPMEISSTDRLKIALDYYQGPMYHIALILLWREWPSDNNPHDAQEGKGGNDYFFDSTKDPSQALAPWTDIQTRWSVVPSEVLYLSADTSTTVTNPCATAAKTSK